jgi:hypothetical protein
MIQALPDRQITGGFPSSSIARRVLRRVPTTN